MRHTIKRVMAWLLDRQLRRWALAAALVAAAGLFVFVDRDPGTAVLLAVAFPLGVWVIATWQQPWTWKWDRVLLAAMLIIIISAFGVVWVRRTSDGQHRWFATWSETQLVIAIAVFPLLALRAGGVATAGSSSGR